MRERWAIGLAILTGVLVLLASAVFAAIQNPAADGSTAGTEPTAAVNVERGRAVYEANSCARCHQVAGKGSPRSPLDGVGGRLSRDELQQWVTGDDAVADDLSQRALVAKRAYRALSEDDLTALLDYLASLQ